MPLSFGSTLGGGEEEKEDAQHLLQLPPGRWPVIYDYDDYDDGHVNNDDDAEEGREDAAQLLPHPPDQSK